MPVSRKELTRVVSGAALLAAAGAPQIVHAQAATPDVAAQIQSLEARLAKQERQLQAQQAELADQHRQIVQQQTVISRQTQQIDDLGGVRNQILRDLRGAGYNVYASSATGHEQSVTAIPPPTAPSSAPPTQIAAAPQQPVGEAPPDERRPQLAAVPPESSVLTPHGKLVIEPQIEYTNTASHILVFRGVEIVPGIQLGVIEASDTNRAAGSAAIDARYGLTSRLEVELRVPYLWRADRISVVQQRDTQITREISLQDQDIGDIEFSARYQINQIKPNFPIFIAGLRVKSDTGSNPFTVPRDQFGVEEKLATGSGYWSAEPSITMLYPTDPAVIYATASYAYGFEQSIKKTISGVTINKVEPGDVATVSMGMGFALNSRFSYSLGYKYAYLWPSAIDFPGDRERSKSAQVGVVALGFSFRLTDRIWINSTYEFGTTADAPNTHIMFRIPITFW